VSRIRRAALAVALAAAGFAGSIAAAGEDGGVSWQDELVLLAPDSDPAARAERLARTVAAAEAGHADAAFLLGVLYRSGEAHPAKALPRDLAQARRWLERCIDATGCTPVALYSLAELELSAGNAQRAMQWGQMASTFDREVARVVADGVRRTSGYLPGLLARLFAALPKAQRSDENVKALLSALVQERGEALARMLDHELEHRRRGREASHPSPKAPDQTRHLRRRRIPDVEVYGLYALEIPAAGGRARRVALVEGLPKPRQARSLDHIAAEMQFVPYAPEGGAETGAGWLPVVFDAQRYTLEEK
jgi:hypothetical protein